MHQAGERTASVVKTVTLYRSLLAAAMIAVALFLVSCTNQTGTVSTAEQQGTENFTDGSASGGLAYYLVIHKDAAGRSSGQLFFVFQDGNVAQTWTITNAKLMVGANAIPTSMGQKPMTISPNWKSVTLPNCRAYMRNLGTHTCDLHWISGPVRTTGPSNSQTSS